MKKISRLKNIACAFILIFWSALLFSSAPVLAIDDVTVVLQIPIMGELKIPVCASQSELGTDGKLHEVLICTGIARYIGIVYQWGVAFAAILAVLAFSYAGVLWLIAGGDSGKVTESKKVMGNAIIGLLLALGSYMLLNAINPNLVTFNALRVPGIARVELDLKQVEDYGEETGDPGGVGGIEIAGDGNLDRLNGLVGDNKQFGLAPSHCLGWVRRALTNIYGNPKLATSPLIGSGGYPAPVAKKFKEESKFTVGLQGIKNGDVVFMQTPGSHLITAGNDKDLPGYSITHIGIYYNGSVYHQFGKDLRISKVQKIPSEANIDNVFTESEGAKRLKVIGYGSMGL
ncbi:MAG: hypothetical protein Q8P56_06500 [Candidatus Uhrbacteria bacterium]|nr:hypothetical protein [Candidatus Uhrbacteria bacterium]